MKATTMSTTPTVRSTTGTQAGARRGDGPAALVIWLGLPSIEWPDAKRRTTAHLPRRRPQFLPRSALSESPGSDRQRGPAAEQKVALGGIAGGGDRRVVRRRRLGSAPHAAEQVGAHRMEYVVALELKTVDEG